jgi:hypothetical protein
VKDKLFWWWCTCICINDFKSKTASWFRIR